VAWVEPSERVIVPNVPVNPLAVTGPFSGGQAAAHAPLQFDLVEVSGAKEYSVKPLLLVSTFTPPIVAEVTLLAPAAAGLLLVPEEVAGAALEAVLDGAELDEELLELHATSATAAAALTGSARRILRFLCDPIRAYDLFITSPSLSDLVGCQASSLLAQLRD
jgi:hypothetical protein